MNLKATYTWTPVGEADPITLTPRIKIRRTPDDTTLTIISRLAPLLAERLDAIPNESDRLHTLTALTAARIAISDKPRPGFDPAISRDRGRLVTTYYGTAALPVSAVLDLAEEIRAAL